MGEAVKMRGLSLFLQNKNIVTIKTDARWDISEQMKK